MGEFQKLTSKGTNALVNILDQLETDDSAYLQARYQDYHEDAGRFEASVRFLQTLGLLDCDENKIRRTRQFQCIPRAFFGKEPDLLKYLVDLVINSDNSLATAIREYLGRFNLREDTLVYSPMTQQRLQEADIRNFLIQFNVIELADSHPTYRVADDYIHLLAEHSHAIFKKGQQPEVLNSLLKYQAEIGDAAELKVLDYEKVRLSTRPDLLEKLFHVSLENTRAGYDIESYEISSTEADPKLRLIEVKAVPIPKYRFFWSRNEIDEAKKLKEQYYLYLLPHIGNKVFDTDNLDIIPNAYSNVFDMRETWAKREESYSIWKAE